MKYKDLRGTTALLCLTVGGVIGLVYGALGFSAEIRIGTKVIEGDLSRFDLATTVLWAVTIVLAALGVIIALAAVVGWRQLMDARKESIDSAVDEVVSQMQPDGTLHKILEAEVDKRLNQGVNRGPDFGPNENDEYGDVP